MGFGLATWTDKLAVSDVNNGETQGEQYYF
jgi:hypothetical protein